MSRIPHLLVALVATAMLALAVGAPVGSGAQNPCTGNYGVAATALVGFESYDTNQNGIVCLYQGTRKVLDPVTDDRTSAKK